MREVKNNRKRLAAATLLASSIGMLGFAGTGAPAQAQAPNLLGSSGTKTHTHLRLHQQLRRDRRRQRHGHTVARCMSTSTRGTWSRACPTRCTSTSPR